MRSIRWLYLLVYCNFIVYCSLGSRGYLTSRPRLEFYGDEALPEKALQQRLPWQGRILFKAFKPRPSLPITVIPQNGVSKLLKWVSNPMAKRLVSLLLDKCTLFIQWCTKHRKTIFVIGKSMIVVYLGKYLLKLAAKHSAPHFNDFEQVMFLYIE
jgi:hypothetical protein